MLKRIFSLDNPVIKCLVAIGNIWMLYLIWLICSLPIITIGASTTALNYSMIKLHRDEGYPVSNFFKSFKENFKQATVMFIIYALVGAILVMDFIIAGSFTDNAAVKMMLRIGAGIIGIPYILTLLYSFGLLSRFNNTIKNTIKNAFFISLKYIIFTVQIILIIGLTAYVCNYNGFLFYVFVSAGFGFIFYFITAYYNRIFKNLEPADPAPADDSRLTDLDLEKAENSVFVKGKNPEGSTNPGSYNTLQ